MKPAASILFLLLAATLSAQPAPPAAPPEARQFDFWIGDWTVTDRVNGKPAGQNLIELKHGGRVLVENYTTPGAYTGMSLNAYDGAARRWHQCWMDSSGGVLDLYGGLVEGKMVLTGETPRAGGVRQLERITWTPNPDGTVRQHWEQSADGGQSWTTAFDGLYRRKSG